MSDFLQQLGADLREAAEHRTARRRRSRLIGAALAAAFVVAAAGSVLVLDPSLMGQDRMAAEEQASPSRQQIPPPAVAPQSGSCAIGARPEYFVPGDDPLVLVGCARLPLSGQLVEFSTNFARIDGAQHLCITPAYGGGRFIPAICKLDPPVSEFAVRDAMHPRQGVDGYGYVVWGTAGGAQSVVAHFDEGIARAARIAVPGEVGREYGAGRFTLFVVELPLSAACRSVSIEADGVTARIGPKSGVCEAAPQSPGA